jgi:hypothetical protein
MVTVREFAVCPIVLFTAVGCGSGTTGVGVTVGVGLAVGLRIGELVVLTVGVGVAVAVGVVTGDVVVLGAGVGVVAPAGVAAPKARAPTTAAASAVVMVVVRVLIGAVSGSPCLAKMRGNR